MVNKVETPPIVLDQDRCSQCLICQSICPFEAISREDGQAPSIDLDKCMVCGMCASACPSGVIEPYYYGYDSMIKHVESKKGEDTENLVVMCRGSSPPSCDILDILQDYRLERSVFLRVPCVGRIPAEFYLKVLSLGLKRIVAVQCTDEFCRFNQGSQMNKRRVTALNMLLSGLGYSDDALTVIENPQQATYDTSKCVGCDKCVYICPYGAIEAQPLSTPKINYDKCTGCGACALVCPHLAIEVKGFEHERLAGQIQNYREKLSEIKSRGISPAILVFCCQWAEFSALDSVRDGFIRDNVALVEIPCFNKLDPINVLQAFRSGFDGVLAVACQDDDCKSKEGRNTAEDNMTVLDATLRRMGLEDNFEVFKTYPRNVGDFEAALDSFVAKVSSFPKK